MSRGIVFFIVMLSVALGLLYVFLVKPGTPYDEQAHFNLVQYYARFSGMPIIGQAEVSYECYQPPLYYALYAFVYRIGHIVSEKFVFYALRIASLILLIPVVIFSFLIAYRAYPHERLLATATAVFVAFNSSLLAIASSIQNDMLVIALSLWAIYLSIAWIAMPSPNLRHAFVLGLIISAAVLTKLAAFFLIIAIPLCAFISWKRNSYGFIGIFFGVVVFLTGWWFIRNHILYGELIGIKTFLKEHMFNFKPACLWELSGVSSVCQSILTYLWLPVEYYRNLVRAGWLLRGIVAAFMLFCAIGWLPWLKLRLRASAKPVKLNLCTQFLFIYYAACLGVYVLGITTQYAVPARAVLPTVAIPAILICGGGLLLFKYFSKIGDIVFITVLCVSLIVINSCVLWMGYHIPFCKFHMFK